MSNWTNLKDEKPPTIKGVLFLFEDKIIEGNYHSDKGVDEYRFYHPIVNEDRKYLSDPPSNVIMDEPLVAPTHWMGKPELPEGLNE